MKTYVAQHNPEKCRECGWCSEIVACPGADELICIGCGACVLACPNLAPRFVDDWKHSEEEMTRCTNDSKTLTSRLPA